MIRRALSLLLLPIALALFTARFAQAQRGGGHGGISGGHASAGSLAAGSRSVFSPSFSRSPQPFGSFYRGPSSSSALAYGRPSTAYSQYGSGSGRRPGYRPGYRGPYFYGYSNYGNYLAPNLLGYPFGLGYGSFFDDDDSGYGQADVSAPQPPPQQGIDAPPENYAPDPPYLQPPDPPHPQPNEQPSNGYRPAYQDSGKLEPATQPATTLVFQDGRPTEQVHNYVLTRTTLYDLDGNGHSDIPIADLNLPATIAANRSAGVNFSLPAANAGD
jgi:hypothetical protein